jgi:hypothetical protein
MQNSKAAISRLTRYVHAAQLLLLETQSALAVTHSHARQTVSPTTQPRLNAGSQCHLKQ